MGKPKLVVVTGPPGSGKTTLAHALAEATGCPMISRDEIKEGLVRTLEGRYEAVPGDPLTARASSVFFEVLEALLKAEVTVVAEAAFQDHIWRPNLTRLSELAHIRIVRCGIDPAIGRKRVADRVGRSAHADASVTADPRYYDNFAPISLSVPTIDVDTSDGCNPPLESIVAFVAGG